MRKIVFLFFISFGLFSCSEPEARRPKQKSTKSFYKELIAKQKQLIRKENSVIEYFIKQDNLHNYKASSTGFWYYYNTKIEGDLAKPKSEDNIEIEYSIADLEGTIIYEKQQKSLKLDKEDFIPALQDGIKLMKVGENITFVIPSYRAFGVTGDENKIGINQTLISNVTLINIKDK